MKAKRLLTLVCRFFAKKGKEMKRGQYLEGVLLFICIMFVLLPTYSIAQESDVRAEVKFQGYIPDFPSIEISGLPELPDSIKLTNLFGDVEANLVASIHDMKREKDEITAQADISLSVQKAKLLDKLDSKVELKTKNNQFKFELGGEGDGLRGEIRTEGKIENGVVVGPVAKVDLTYKQNTLDALGPLSMITFLPQFPQEKLAEILTGLGFGGDVAGISYEVDFEEVSLDIVEGESTGTMTVRILLNAGIISAEDTLTGKVELVTEGTFLASVKFAGTLVDKAELEIKGDLEDGVVLNPTAKLEFDINNSLLPTGSSAQVVEEESPGEWPEGEEQPKVETPEERPEVEKPELEKPEEEPEVEKPEEEKPEVEKPEVEEPELEKPEEEKPELEKPEEEPEVEKPEVEKPEEEPEVEKPELEKPELEKPEVEKPEEERPEVEKPEEEKPEVEKPEAETAVKADKALKVVKEKLADLLKDVGEVGITLPPKQLDALNASLEKAQTALEEGNFKEAEKLAKEARKFLGQLKEKAGAMEEISDAKKELAELLEDAGSVGIELPQDKLDEFEALLTQANETLEAESFEKAEDLAEQSEELLDTIRDQFEKLEKTAKEVAEDVQKAEKDVHEAAEEAAEAAQEAAEATGKDAVDAAVKAIGAAKKAAEKAEKAARKARKAAEKAREENTKEAKKAAAEAESAAEEATFAALIAAENVAKAAERVAENTQKARDIAKKALKTLDSVKDRRAFEDDLLAAENAAKQVMEAAEIVNENVQRAAENAAKAAEKAAEKAKNTGNLQDEMKAQEAAKAAEEAAEEAIRTAQEAAGKVASASAVAAENAALIAETDALEADVNASEAAKQPVKEAQKLARKTTIAFEKAKEKAEKAAEEAQIAAEKAEKAADEASRLAAEKAKKAAEKAKEAKDLAEQAAKRAGKEATDLNDDGINNIFDLVFVGKLFGRRFASLEEEGVISDINGDGVVDIKDLVLTARGLMDGIPIPTEEKETAAAAPSRNASTNVWLRINQRKSEAFSNTLRIDLMTDGMQDLYAFQFEMSFDSDVLEPVGVEEGNLLSSDESATYWYLPEIVKSGTISAACTRIASKGVSETGVLATVTFKVKKSRWRLMKPLQTVTLKISDVRGDIVESKLEAKGLDFRKVLMPRSTKLLQNYPNPFNPETWIPYQLTEPAEVVIRIYNTTGRLVRTLNLGHKADGFHVKRGKAAHWDGKNEYGEKVASGVYFYHMEADSFRAIRKMVIMK